MDFSPSLYLTMNSSHYNTTKQCKIKYVRIGGNPQIIPGCRQPGNVSQPVGTLYVLIRFDESVLAVVAFIYNACAFRLPVIENEEIMAEHVHLQYCLFRIHRFQLELFGADNIASGIGFVILFLPEFMVRIHFQFGEEVLLRILFPELAVDLRLMLPD